MFEDPPEQLRQEADLDGLTLMVGGIRYDRLHHKHPVMVSIAAVFVGAVMISSHPLWAAAFALAVVWGYHYFTHGDPEQISVRLTPTHIQWSDHDLALGDLTAVRLEQESSGPVIDLHGADEVVRLYMQLEPMEHAVWLADALKRARLQALREDTGSVRDVPRALRDGQSKMR